MLLRYPRGAGFGNDSILRSVETVEIIGASFIKTKGSDNCHIIVIRSFGFMRVRKANVK